MGRFTCKFQNEEKSNARNRAFSVSRISRSASSPRSIGLTVRAHRSGIVERTLLGCPRMREAVLTIRGFCVLITTLATLLAASGCGSSGSDEVTVRTGSITKAEFIAKADAVCKAARDEFRAQYTSFLKAHQSAIGNKQKEEALFGEYLESILSPNIEGQIEQISKIGAPKDYRSEERRVGKECTARERAER